MSRYIAVDSILARWYRTSVRGRTEFDQVIANIPSIDLADYVPKDFHDKTCEAMAKAHQEEIADMVSVVRCKGCKWYDADTDWANIPYCDKHHIEAYEDGFCSYGEREGE